MHSQHEGAAPVDGRRFGHATVAPTLREMFARAREVVGLHQWGALGLLLASIVAQLAQLSWAPLAALLATERASKLSLDALAGILVVGLAAIGFKVLSRTLRARLNARIIFDLQCKLHETILALGADFHRERGRGELVQATMQSSAGAASFGLELMVTPVTNGMATLAGLGLLAQQFRDAKDPLPVIAAVLALVLALPYASIKIAGRLRSIYSQVRAQQTVVHEQLAQSLTDPLGLQMAHATSARQGRFEVVTKALLPTQMKASVVSGVATELPALAGILLQLLLLAAVLLSSSDAVRPGALASSAMVAVLLAPQVASSIASLMATYSMGSQMWPEVEQVFSILDMVPALTEGAVKADFADAPEITLEDVTFQYDHTADPVLRSANLVVPAGATTAIVAASGAGKSTVLRLLGRLYDVQHGTVRMGGTDVREFRFESLRAYGSVARCAQEPTFINASVRENFLLFVPDAHDEAIAKACQDVGIWDAMNAASPGDPLALVVTNNQAEGALSGGQRKRLELARALCASPRVLLLDEPTTGVAKTDKPALVRAVKQAADGRTCIIVEHDLEFVRAVSDRVAVLDEGRFIEEDTIATLMATDSAFRRLCATTLGADAQE